MAKEKMKSTLTSYEEVDKQLYELAKLEAFLAEQEASLNQELLAVEGKYKSVTKLTQQKYNALKYDIQLFALEHKKEFSDKKRSMKFSYGSFAFRSGSGAVVILKKFKDAAKVIAQDLFNWKGMKYVRIKYEMNKEAILNDYNKEVLDDIDLAAMNLRVNKGESVNIKINWKALEKEGLKLVEVKKSA